MNRVDGLSTAEGSDPKTTPMKQRSGGITRERRQAALKSMMEVEVGGAVFESATVHRVFFVERQDLIDSIVPFDDRRVKTLVAALRNVGAEPEAYTPLTDLFTLIVAESAKKSQKSKAQHSRKRHVSVFFRVYTKEMKTKVDGAGHLKPDVLSTKRPYGEDKPVPWAAVRIAIEVKLNWREGLQQALTYARSMLEVGDKWYALVLVYNHAEQKLCFCFATRQGVFLSPPWDLTKEEGYTLAADALLHACYATGAEAGLDPNRCLDAAGTRFLRVPTLPSWIRLKTELFSSIQVLGRATHVYAAQSDTTFKEPAEEPDCDPANFSQKLKEPKIAPARGQPMLSLRSGLVRSATAVDDALQIALSPIPLSLSPRPAPSDTSSPSASPATSHSTSQGDRALPGATGVPTTAPTPTGTDGTASSSDAAWEALCAKGETSWAEDAVPRLLKSPFVAKEGWVVSSRADMEIKILKAVRGQWAHVEYAGHTIIAHPGMERLAQFRSPPAKGEASRKSRVWPDTFLGEEPKLLPRDHRVIFYTPEGCDLVKICDKPDRVAHAMKDIATALLVLHKKGFTHRDLSIWNVVGHDEPRKNAPGMRFLPALFGDRWNDFEQLFNEQHVFVIDFDHAVSWLEQRKVLPERSATWAFMAAARIKAWINKAPWIDTLIDDLESALWSLFYATLKANLKHLSEMEKLHYESFESDNAYLLAATKHMFLAFRKDEVRELSALKASWPLWWRLVEVARRSRDEVTAVKDLLGSGETFATTTEENRTRLNEVCQKAVVGYIQAVKEALTEMALAENEL